MGSKLNCIIQMPTTMPEGALEIMALDCDCDVHKTFIHKEYGDTTKVRPAPGAVKEYITRIVVTAPSIEHKKWFDLTVKANAQKVKELENLWVEGTQKKPVRWINL